MRVIGVLFLGWTVGLAGGVAAADPLSPADDCELATSAAIAQAQAPHAVTQVTLIPDEESPMSVQMIFTHDTAYLRKDGAWRTMPYSAQAQIDVINAGKKRAEPLKRTCQKTSGEEMRGEATTLLLIHTEAIGKISDARIWIADKSGLPLKSEIRLDSGVVVIDEFRYDSIAPPTDVK